MLCAGRPRDRRTDGTGSCGPRKLCRYSQQAAEKALKAVLALECIEFPYINDRQRLRNLFPDGWPAGPAPNVFASLAAWGSGFRYPEDWPEPTADDASRAEVDARTVQASRREARVPDRRSYVTRLRPRPRCPHG
ncbi:MAG: HEPN domain-containing protein [Gammaproteobacteria bacterium]|nr:HEPN domain-containing protein [Gammaproteobacteria bacterium]